MNTKVTSDEVAEIAASYVKVNMVGFYNMLADMDIPERAKTLLKAQEQIRAMAASCLAQADPSQLEDQEFGAIRKHSREDLIAARDRITRLGLVSSHASELFDWYDQALSQSDHYVSLLFWSNLNVSSTSGTSQP